MNILQATYLAFRTAIENLKIKPQIALIDGNRIGELPCDYELIVKGDAKSQSIAAASILAKVSRDRYMMEMDALYPEYNFKKHKGYGTKAHYAAILEQGPCLSGLRNCAWRK